MIDRQVDRHRQRDRQIDRQIDRKIDRHLWLKCKYMHGSQNNFRGRPNISANQPILVQPKYKPT